MIDCKYKKQKRIFINHRGNVIPCCHLNSEMMEWSAGKPTGSRFVDVLNDNGGELSINLDYNEIDEAMEGEVWDAIIESWNDVPLEKCYQTCKLKDQDIFEVELL